MLENVQKGISGLLNKHCGPKELSELTQFRREARGTVELTLSRTWATGKWWHEKVEVDMAEFKGETDSGRKLLYYQFRTPPRLMLRMASCMDYYDRQTIKVRVNGEDGLQTPNYYLDKINSQPT